MNHYLEKNILFKQNTYRNYRFYRFYLFWNPYTLHSNTPIHQPTNTQFTNLLIPSTVLIGTKMNPRGDNPRPHILTLPPPHRSPHSSPNTQPVRSTLPTPPHTVRVREVPGSNPGAPTQTTRLAPPASRVVHNPKITANPTPPGLNPPQKKLCYKLPEPNPTITGTTLEVQTTWS